jgi:tetratricopeptide (TPR) repeat protein
MRGNDVSSVIDPNRVAEVIVTAANGVESRGSGYRISATALLTAAHVIRNASRVVVRFNADGSDEWVAEITESWAAASADVAVLVINRSADRDMPASLFGRIGDAGAELPYSAVGFPRFKLRRGSARSAVGEQSWQYRDSLHAVGTIATLSNRRSRRLEIGVPPPERDPDPQHSPWEGMSGAPLWVAGRIVGLISEHHPSDGLARLTATRVDGWYEQLDSDQLRRLCQMTGLPAVRDDLPDVIPLVHTSSSLRNMPMARVRDWDPYHLKIHRPITMVLGHEGQRAALPDMPPYVARDVDQVVRREIMEASQDGGAILLIGQSCMGKTRSAYEAVLAELSEWHLFHPGSAAEVNDLADYEFPQTELIFWLDEAQDYLTGPDSLKITTVRKLLSAGRAVIFVMTMWPDWYDELSAPPPAPRKGSAEPLDIHRDARQILDLAHKIQIGRFSAVERQRARDLASLDPRIEAALEDPDYSLPQVLAAAPDLVRRWMHSSNPYGAALITAALGLRCIRIEGPLGEQVLREVAPAYLSARDRSIAPSDWFARAMAYACQELKGATAALLPVPGPGVGVIVGYTLAEFLRQYGLMALDRNDIPDDLWGAVLHHVSRPDDLYRAALEAARIEGSSYAEPLFRHAIDTATDPSQKDFAGYARRGLGDLLLRQHRIEEAIAIAREAVNAGDRDARSNLATLLEFSGHRDEVLDVLQRPTDTDVGDWAALEIMLGRRGKFDEAIDMLYQAVAAGNKSALFSLEEELKRQGRAHEMVDVWRREISAGYPLARMSLAMLLVDLERDDEAVAVLREGITLGEPNAWREYLDMLQHLRRYDDAIMASYEAEALGEPFKAIRVAALLHLSGRADETIEGLRHAAANGDSQAESDLTALLHARAGEYARLTPPGRLDRGSDHFGADGRAFMTRSGEPARDSFGSVVAWGDDKFGQASVPSGLHDVTAIAAGEQHNLALHRDGHVSAWGNSSFDATSVPAGLTDVIAIAAGGHHSLALRRDGTVAAWGQNDRGQTNVPTWLTDVIAIAAGHEHSLALIRYGRIAAWGWNEYDQIRVPDELYDVTAIAAGCHQSLALRRDGRVAAWGWNDEGPVRVPAGLHDVAAITAGVFHCVALQSDGRITAWGNNELGQSSVPSGLNEVTAITAGLGHTLALQRDGRIIAWGNNELGQRTVPGELCLVTAVAAGNTHNLAIVPV